MGILFLRLSLKRAADGGVQNSKTEGGDSMPTYEYLCQNCNKDFSVVMSISQYEQGKVKCPECGKEEVKQQVTPFVAQTSRKS